MADPKLVEVLSQGSEVWNSWRKHQSEFAQIDLSHANLSQADLSYADLSYSDLGGANLNYANLFRAGLSHANLSYADMRSTLLSKADLSKASLGKANLSRADLRGAYLSEVWLNDAKLTFANLSDAYLGLADLRNSNLSHSILYNTNLIQAKLDNANLSEAEVGRTAFAGVDLSKVKGLATLQHGGPSHVELRSIQLPQDGSALHFLRGCGVPDEWIDFYCAQMMSPIQFYSCFISYSHRNEDFVKQLHADLQREGVRCWFAEEDLKIGDHYHQRIDEAIRLYDKLTLVLSDAAVNSAWVEREVVAAQEKEDRQKREVLFPLRLDDSVMETEKAWAADVRRRWHIGDFTRWKDHDSYQQAFERLLRDLKAETKGESNG